MKNILRDPMKLTGTTTGTKAILTELFRRLLLEMEVNMTRWEYFMTSYLNDRRNRIPNNRRDIASVRGNLVKEFSKEKMTWNVFCKALRFLKFSHFEITFYGISRDERHREVLTSVKVSLDNDPDFEESFPLSKGSPFPQDSSSFDENPEASNKDLS